MKKLLLLVYFAFFSSFIYGQVVEYPSGILTEDRIGQILENARKNGTKEWELEHTREVLYKRLQQQRLQMATGSQASQRGGTPPHVNSNGCVNPGFENNTTSGWTLTYGSNSGSTLPCPSCINTAGGIYQVTSAVSTSTVNSANCYLSNTAPYTNGVDNYGGFPVVAPAPSGGNYSLLLNNSCCDYKMQQAQYSFVVGTSNPLFTFQYAAVLQDGGHTLSDSPYFSVDVIDVATGNPVSTCTQYSAVATSGNLNGWVASSVGTGVSYKPWSTVTIDLSSIINHTVNIKFTVSDCNQGGHFGYCYIDADCGNLSSASSVTGFCGTNNASISMVAPPGYQSYQWYGPNPNFNTPISGATSQTLTTNANINDTFVVKGTFSAGCVSTFSLIVRPTGININTSATASCKGGTSGSVSAVVPGNGSFTYSWTGPLGALGTNTTVANLAPGAYTVHITDATNHCVPRDTVVTVVGISPTLQTVTSQLCGTKALLTAPAGTSYYWYDNSNTHPATNSTSQTYSVTNGNVNDHYTVTYIDPSTHCEDSLRYTFSQVTIGFTPITSPACTGGNTGSVQLNANPNNTYTTYDWNINGGSFTTNAAPPFTVNNLAPGSYTVVITAPGNNTCADIETFSITATGLGTIPPPVPVKTCNQDVVSLSPGVAGSTSNWYTTTGTLLSTSDPFVLTPAQNVNNAIYVDTIKNAAGCKSVYKVQILLKSFKANITVVEQLKCFGDSVGKLKGSITTVVNGPIGSPDTYTFTWAPSPFSSPNPTTGTGPSATSIMANLKANTYTLTISNGNCVSSITKKLNDGLRNTNDSILAYYCPKDSLALLVADTGNSKYQWYHNGVPLTASSNASYNKDSIRVPVADMNSYFVTYKHGGCPDSAKTFIEITTYNAFHPDTLVNVFTPNNDKKNDFFYPFHNHALSQYQIGRQSDTYEIHIYDRWGKEVFSSTEYNKPWDGKTKGGADADNGSYFYVVKYKGNCGTKADLESKKGFVELLR